MVLKALETPLILFIAWNLEFSRQIFEKKKKAQTLSFITNRPVGPEVFHVGRRIGRHDEGNNSSFSQFCERA
jgi:hypothetical protein